MIYLDSASTADATLAAELGYVAGITTNPTLMATTGGDPLAQLQRLLDMFGAGSVFYQLTDLAAPRQEAEQALAAGTGRVVLKVPATRDMFRLVARMLDDGVQDARFAVTALYTPAQALLAAQVGAEWIIPYVDRASRLLDGGGGLVAALAAVLARTSGGTRILAASIKSPDQAVQAVLDGAHAVTMPIEVVTALSEHGLTEQAVAEFAAATRRSRP